MVSLENQLFEEYLKEIENRKHIDNVVEVLKYIKSNYNIPESQLKNITNILSYLQMAYFATDDLIDEGNDVWNRVISIEKLHFAIHRFYQCLLDIEDVETRNRLIELYDLVFLEMLVVPQRFHESVTRLNSLSTHDINELVETLAKIQILRAKHVMFYWVIGLGYVEKNISKIFYIANLHVKKRAQDLIKKDFFDIDNDKETGSFNIYNFFTALRLDKHQIDHLISLVFEKIEHSKLSLLPQHRQVARECSS